MFKCLLKKYFVIFFIIKSNALSAVVPNLDLIDSVTAVTLPQASYDISLTFYTSGSLLMKALIGLHDNFYLGASFDIESVIGNKKIKPNIPGVIAKIKFTDGWDSFPILIAIGYDSFYLGNNDKIKANLNSFKRVVYGPYLALSKPIFLFGEEQHIHMGVRMPMQPNYLPNNAAVYFGIDFPISFFIPMFEINRIYFQKGRLKEILFNLGLKFNIVDNFSIELNFLIGMEKNVDRIFNIEYVNYF